MREKWHEVLNASEVPSPCLLIYPDRVRENIHRMIHIAGGVERLRPHMKTHKIAEVIRMQMEQGITKFKCATIAEAELTAAAGADDVLLAYQPVGPNVHRLIRLVKSFPQTKFSVIADDAEAIRALSAVSPGPKAVELCRLIASLAGLKAGGLHAYDGHIHDSDVTVRTKNCEAAFAPVAVLRQELLQAGLPVPQVVAGGTPTFPMHARRGDVECSPGTCIFWDAGYASKFGDMDFLPAALVLSRVISKPGANRLCLDLGHKSIASEMPHPRVQFLSLPDEKAVAHSEEHLVVETVQAEAFKVGDCLYGIPWHICPTVALHSEAVVVENGKATQKWKIVGRERRLTI
ncbi:MAG: threonine aldolase [Verrucomicrobia bacterium]|nr:MAG: threonine aldolase [Verrucomicrobiota bacterium]